MIINVISWLSVNFVWRIKSELKKLEAVIKIIPQKSQQNR